MSQSPFSSPVAKRQHLSVDFEKHDTYLGHRRSSSASIGTTIEDNPNIEVRKADFKRHGTHVASVNLTRWDLFKAFCFTGVESLRRKIAVKVEWADPEGSDERIFDEKENPYTLTVSVYKHHSDEFIPARCVIDTGCVQGNIISVDLAHRLGFTEADFRELSAREANGGMVATGDIHKVIGAIRISWFHYTSTKIFKAMRFLVSETTNVDLVIGTRSIMKENLLHAPNLHSSTPDNTYTQFTKGSDSKRNKLADDYESLDSKIITRERAIKKMQQGTERGEAEEALKKMEKARDVAEMKLELHDVKNRLSTKNGSKQDQKRDRERKTELEGRLGIKDTNK